MKKSFIKKQIEKNKSEQNDYSFQCRINKTVFDKTKTKMKKENLKWRDLVETLFQVYLEK